MREIATGGNTRHEWGWKKGLRHVRAVIKGMLATGFTLQILLGIIWMCCNFGQVQDFNWLDLEREGSGGGIFVLCRSLFGLLGRQPALLYVLQLGFAFYAGYRFLKKHVAERISADANRRRGFCVWGSLALLTFPFAMQCHLAILPYSAMGSLFLLMLSFLLEAAGSGSGDERQDKSQCKNNGKRRAGKVVMALVCGGLAVILAGSTDADSNGQGGVWGRGVEAALASRFAWPDIWNDFGYWPEELRTLAEDVMWETTYCPGNMDILLEALEERAGETAAKEYYSQIAGIGWQNHKSIIVRQMGWDVLGYLVTPLVFPLQMRGEAYDSYTGRNYEAMGMHTPVLTRYYVYYGCWWFGCCLVLSLVMSLLWLPEGGSRWKTVLTTAGICILAAGIPVFLYTMRGAGFLDYKCTVAVNELWLVWGLLCMRGGRDVEEKEKL